MPERWATSRRRSSTCPSWNDCYRSTTRTCARISASSAGTTYGAGDHAGPRCSYQRALEIDPDNAQASSGLRTVNHRDKMAQGHRALEEKDYDRAVDCFRQARAIDPDSVDAKYYENLSKGYVALAGGKPIEWNSEKMQVTNAPDANRLIRRQYRDGWSL